MFNFEYTVIANHCTYLVILKKVVTFFKFALRSSARVVH